MEQKFSYKKRIADDLLALQLEAAGYVVIEGAKWCGKTTTALQQAKSVIYLDSPEMQEDYERLATINITRLLEGDTPRLLDEWQKFPQLWDACRFVSDRRQGDGHFILTGSATPIKTDKISHSGTGRAAWLKMRTMTLWESGESNGDVSLQQLFDGQLPDGSAHIDIDQIAFLICRGGWPKGIDKSERVALKQPYNYIDAIAKQEIQNIDEINRSEINTRKLLRSFARHQGSQASYATIAADINANDKGTISDQTVASYIKALCNMFVIEDMEAWNPNLRSKSAIRTANTHYFTDPSIAIAALGIGPKDLTNDLDTLGLMFETLVVRDLRVYAEAIDGQLFHYRDSNGLECDAVIHLRNGHYGLVEIKLGGEKLVEEGAKALHRLGSKIDTNKMYAPSFKMVVTAVGQYAYQREDGVYIVPIGCLKP